MKASLAPLMDGTVIIPTLNEAKSLALVVTKLKEVGYNRILVVDGNSKDRTAEIAKEMGVNVIVQSGKGKGMALRQAFAHGGLVGRVVVMIDADGSMNPGELPVFTKAIASGADIVKGSRFLPDGGSEDMSSFRRIGNGLFVLLVNMLWGANYTDLCYGYAVFKRNVIVDMQRCLSSENFEIEAEVFIKAKKMGFRVTEVPSIERRREYGKSNLNSYLDGFRILKTIIKELVNSP